ncbi:hypothetical protein R4K51_01080 [Pseudomonas aeruginosa]|uniref:hypothetical protein n=1 Tax=Pseudomonas aeruginosa TaxID=287 RepID=UPI002955C5AF|nr:hypothetical protein [Pseudomonas aeruginosa]MDV7831879.1 hypothetical protein [Pseudomonas aeruginosa]
MSVRLWLFLGGTIGLIFGLYLVVGVLSFSADVETLVGGSTYAFLKEVAVPMTAGFGGAIAGACSSYFLTRKENQVRQVEIDTELINTSLYLLMSKLSEIVAIRKQGFFPHGEAQARFLTIPLYSTGGQPQPSLDMRIITVLGRVGIDDISEKIYKAENGYIACLNHLNIRNDMFLQVRDLAERSGILKGDSVMIYKYVLAVGMPRLLALYDVTENLIGYIDSVIEDVKDALLAIERARERFVVNGRVSVMSLSFSDFSDSKLPAPHFEDRAKLEKYLAKSVEVARLSGLERE